MARKRNIVVDTDARDVETNNYFELQLLDKHGNPWHGTQAKPAIVTAKTPPSFIMSARWKLAGPANRPPAFIALLLAGTALDIRAVKDAGEFEDFDTEEIVARREVCFRVTKE